MSRLPPNFHAVQISLDLPRILSVPPFTKLPNPNPIDSWLALNYTDTIRDIYSPGHLYLGDLLSDEMLCILQLNAQMVSPLLSQSQELFLNPSSDSQRRLLCGFFCIQSSHLCGSATIIWHISCQHLEPSRDSWSI